MPVSSGSPERRHVAPRRQSRERREEHGRDRDREDALRQHVEAEGEVDRPRRELGVDQPRGEQRPDQRRDVDQAERQRDREHEHEEPAHRRVAPVEDEPKTARRARGATAPAGAAAPASRGRSSRRRRTARRPRRRPPGTPRTRPRMITRFHATGVSAGTVNWSYALRIPTMIPERASRITIGKRSAREADREVEVAAGRAEQLDDQRRREHEDRREPGRDEEDEPEDRRRDPPRAGALALLEQLAEDRDERARERRVGDERADEVRDLERDRERVDLDPPRRTCTRRPSPGRARAPATAPSRRRRRPSSGRAGGGGRAPPRARDRRSTCSLIQGSFVNPAARPSATIRAPACRGRSHVWRTSSNRRSACRSRAGSGSRTCAIARRSRRSSSASRRRVAEGDEATVSAEHRELVRTIDKAAARGALHKNTAARKKSQAATALQRAAA